MNRDQNIQEKLLREVAAVLVNRFGAASEVRWRGFLELFLFGPRERFRSYAEGLLTAEEFAAAIVDAGMREFLSNGPLVDDSNRAATRSAVDEIGAILGRGAKRWSKEVR